MTATISIESDDAAYSGLAERGAAPLWCHLGELFLPEPRSAAVPYHWDYAELRRYAMHFAERLPIEDAQRRVC